MPTTIVLLFEMTYLCECAFPLDGPNGHMLGRGRKRRDEMTWTVIETSKDNSTCEFGDFETMADAIKFVAESQLPWAEGMISKIEIVNTPPATQ